MFMDIAGFTAWSSERQPTQVFQLLEGIYKAFDEIAKKLRVFKVETIGDSYVSFIVRRVVAVHCTVSKFSVSFAGCPSRVCCLDASHLEKVAVCGVPTPREDHATIMVRFADRCLKAMTRVTHELEVLLGPSTGDLEARVGLHSGPVTAGVLRGEKARFQLFGDTVNTASRIESSGEPGKIHASKVTVDLLIEAGKGNWAVKREEKVLLKGKGELETFWVSSISVTPTASSASGRSPALPSASDSIEPKLRSTEKQSKDLLNRLVDWNVAVLLNHLEKVVSHGAARNQARESDQQSHSVFNAEEAIVENVDGKLVIDEMSHTLAMPTFLADAYVQNNGASPNSSHTQVIGPKVQAELRDFVSRIAKSYRNVPFHNFDHVSHVIMSTSKLLQRIVNPDGIDYEQDSAHVAWDVHRKTYGISSDPLLQFAAVFSALIHDVEHTGLTNAELTAKGDPLAVRYRNQSVAEQHSVDVAWAVLMESRYRNLRACIYTNESELRHFRMLIVNAVMATDIADKKLKEYREGRWDVAFAACDGGDSGSCSAASTSVATPGGRCDPTTTEDGNRKATIVYEYLIQASDVAHTMQHWCTYRKFNGRLFEERYLAWLNGHMDREPSRGWYEGEIWFFDNYIIPLADRLAQCGVFGVSYHEYLTYAKDNRKEWEIKGRDIVATLQAECDAKYAEHLAKKKAEGNAEGDAVMA
jgi:class 3 adenylate cyclase